MTNHLRPDWTRLHPNLSKRQRITAVSLIVFGALVSILCFIIIFALADLGRPSFLPWIAWFLFGVGPIITALEEYGAEDSESAEALGATTEGEATDVEALPGRPVPPRLHLIHSPDFTTDRPYNQEEDHGHHARTAI